MPQDRLTVATLAERLGIAFEGDGDIGISAAAHPADAGPEDLAVATGAEFFRMLEGRPVRAAMLAEGMDWRAAGLHAALIAPRPRYALAHVTAAFALEEPLAEGVHPSAVIGPGAEIGAGARIGPFVYIAGGARLGANARVHAHCSIGAGARIGDDALLHCGARIGGGASIGARAIVHPNAVIASDGFSFVTPRPGAVEQAKAGGGNINAAEEGRLVRIHSLAAVTLGDDVEIGACTTIDRGTLRDTRIGSGTKIDNQVQIGHNVSIGEGCMLCAQVGIAGSAEIGDRVVLGGKVGVADHVRIGPDVLVAAASAVASNVKSRSIVMGVPAVPRDEAVRSVMALRRLPRLAETVQALKKRLSDMDSAG